MSVKSSVHHISLRDKRENKEGRKCVAITCTRTHIHTCEAVRIHAHELLLEDLVYWKMLVELSHEVVAKREGKY